MRPRVLPWVTYITDNRKALAAYTQRDFPNGWQLGDLQPKPFRSIELKAPDCLQGNSTLGIEVGLPRFSGQFLV